MPTDKRQRQKEARRQRQEAMKIAQQRAARRRQGIRLAALLITVIAVMLLIGVFRGGDDKTDVTAVDKSTSTTAPAGGKAEFGSTDCPDEDGESERTVTFTDSFKKCIDPKKTYTAVIEFDAGEIEVELAASESPVTVNNFVSLARHRFYDGVVCHRVLKGFMAQCGDPEGTGSGGPGYTIGEEPPKSGKYEIGQLAMAKTGAPNSTGSQFFIIVGEQGASLPPQYSLLGTVTAGMDVAKKIEADGADADPTPPAVLHKILKVTIKES